MNRLTAALADVCRQQMLAEKWLIAPSRRVGQQWLEAVTRSGGPVINARVKTLASMAIDLAAEQMADRNVTLLPQRGRIFLIERIVRELRADRLKYLQRIASSAGLAETVYRSIDSIRLSGLEEKQLARQSFEVPDKGDDLKAILRAYLAALEAHHCIDDAELYRLAAGRLRGHSSALPPDLLLLIPADIELRHAEGELLEAFPADKRISLPVDELLGADRSIRTDLELLRWLPDPSDAPSAVGDGSVTIRRAIGEVNEVRDVLRRCLSGEIQFDHVELLHTDAATYVPLVYETLCAVDRNGQTLGDGMPVTFAEGVPCTYSRPGRALALWTAWIGDGYPQATLVQMLRDGLLELPQAEDAKTSFGRLAALLRTVGIGFGRERYVRLLRDRIASIEGQIEAGVAEADEDDEPNVARAEARQRELQQYQTLIGLCESLLTCAPKNLNDQVALLQSAEKFLATHVRSISQLDRFAVLRLTADVQDMARWLADGNQTEIDVMDWLARLPGEARVLGSGPRPGCIHVAHALAGGHTGRPYVFIIGLDDSRFPGAGMQDPLLLDAERRKLSVNLPTAASRLQRKLSDFARLLARLRGRVTLSYCSQGVSDDREMFPSSAIMSAFRLISGQRTGDHSDLLKWLDVQGPVACFAPALAEESLNAAEWWQWRLCGAETVHEAERMVLEHHPHLARGLHAVAQRRSGEFTEFDGRVEAAGLDLDPRRSETHVFSANRLQTIGRCPLKYFYQYGLGIESPRELSVDPNVWLSALDAGALLHEVFERFMRKLVAANRLPDFKQDSSTMRALLAERLEHYRHMTPPPSEGVFQRQAIDLEQSALTFLKEEEHYCRQQQCRPVYLEASLGMPSEEHGTPLDTAEPVPIALAGGGKIRLRGRIDRIDLVGDGAIKTYRVWDYKTGSTYGYDRADPFREGRVLQPFLYVTMVAHRLREAVDPQAEVSHFGFFFPGKKARGERIEWSREDLAEGEKILAQLVQIVANGAFLPTTDAADCTYCDYLSICGDAEASAASSALKLESAENELLVPMRSLRNG